MRDEDNVTSDFCGGVSIGMDAFKNKPNEWVVNEILNLTVDKKLQGSVYIQAKFIPEGQQDDGKTPNNLEHLKKK